MENKTNYIYLQDFQSGKTTFLTNVLNDLKGSKVAVMMGQKSPSFKAVDVSNLILLYLLTLYPYSYSYLQLRNRLFISKIRSVINKLKTVGSLVKSSYLKNYTFCISTTVSTWNEPLGLMSWAVF